MIPIFGIIIESSDLNVSNTNIKAAKEINTTIKSNVTQSSIAIPNEYDAGGPYDFLKEKNFLTALQISERIKSEL